MSDRLEALAAVVHLTDEDCDIPEEHGAEALALLRQHGFDVVPLARTTHTPLSLGEMERAAEFWLWGLRSEFVRSAPPAVVSRLAVWRLLRGSKEEFERVFPTPMHPKDYPEEGSVPTAVQNVWNESAESHE